MMLTCTLAKCPKDNEIVVFLDPFQLWWHTAKLDVSLIKNNQNWKRQYSKDLRTRSHEYIYKNHTRHSNELREYGPDLLIRHHAAVGVVRRSKENHLGFVRLHSPPKTDDSISIMPFTYWSNMSKRQRRGDWPDPLQIDLKSIKPRYRDDPAIINVSIKCIHGEGGRTVHDGISRFQYTTH